MDETYELTETMQSLVKNRRAELGLSLREAAARSGSGGKGVSHTTIGRIEEGTHSGRYSDKTLAGLALALDLPQSRVRAAAGRKYMVPAIEWRLPKKAAKLTPSERKVILALIDQLIAAHEDNNDNNHAT